VLVFFWQRGPSPCRLEVASCVPSLPSPARATPFAPQRGRSETGSPPTQVSQGAPKFSLLVATNSNTSHFLLPYLHFSYPSTTPFAFLRDPALPFRFTCQLYQRVLRFVAPIDTPSRLRSSSLFFSLVRDCNTSLPNFISIPPTIPPPRCSQLSRFENSLGQCLGGGGPGGQSRSMLHPPGGHADFGLGPLWRQLRLNTHLAQPGLTNINTPADFAPSF